jgi:hypothetical protein
MSWMSKRDPEYTFTREDFETYDNRVEELVDEMLNELVSMDDPFDEDAARREAKEQAYRELGYDPYD